MPEANPSPSILRFGVFELDLRAGELRKQGLKVKLQERPFQILSLLLENPGEVVTREELRKQLWAGNTFVDFDHGINTAIKKLREALGDSADNPRFIETLPRHGYRFIGSAKFSERLRALPQSSHSDPAEPELKVVPDRPPAEQQPAAGERMWQAALVPRRARLLLYIAGTLVAATAIAISGAGVYRYFRPVPKTSAPPMNVVPITSFPGREIDPSFSPDGKQIAFAWNGEKEDNWDIYVKVIGTESVLRLTTNLALDHAPSWSPDGRYIAFYRRAGSQDGIYLIPALGGQERRLYSRRVVEAQNADSPNWSPDGKFLAFCETIPGEKSRKISVFSVDTVEKRVVTTLFPSTDFSDLSPRYSPDGRTIAFVCYTSAGNPDLCLVPSLGGKVRRLTHNAGISGLTWMADNTHLIYSTHGGLWKISAAGGEAERFPISIEYASDPVLSRDGRRLAYVREFEDVNVWRYEVPRAPGRAMPPTRLIASTQYDGSQQFSGRKEDRLCVGPVWEQ